MNEEIIQIETEDGLMSEHYMVSQDNSEGLLIMFPGGNNSCDRPVMHFVRKAMLLDNFNVLSISYTNLRREKQSPEERVKSANIEIAKLYTKLKIQDYSKVYILSRSFGNVLASSFRKDLDIEVGKHCFIAPIPQAMDNIIELGGLVITGTRDDYMSESNRQVLIDRLDDNCFVIDGANHSFESDHSIDETLEITRSAVMKIVGYFEE